MTDKTISKWETGYRLPDALLLLELSSALKVDINELLAGEEFSSKEIPSEEYMKKTENNILGLVNELNEIDKKSRGKNIGVLLGFLLTSLAFLYLVVVSLRTGRIADIFDFPTLFYLMGLKFAILSICGCSNDYLNAWRTFFPKRELSRKEVESAIQAVDYAGALTVALGCLISLLSLFSLLNYMDQSISIWTSLAQIVLTLLYTAIGKVIYVILSFRMRQMI